MRVFLQPCSSSGLEIHDLLGSRSRSSDRQDARTENGLAQQLNLREQLLVRDPVGRPQQPTLDTMVPIHGLPKRWSEPDVEDGIRQAHPRAPAHRCIVDADARGTDALHDVADHDSPSIRACAVARGAACEFGERSCRSRPPARGWSLTVRYLEPGRKRRTRKLSLTPVLWFLAAAMVLVVAALALIR